ncbi:hypothetical protein TrRE_jg10094 [Triparma retinervis]|uniref:Uncharacterized protein n=1 Tax=Triparma retinervis TaxID=2557542 RepID=A0A9W7F7B1_9STRA|nr:hypothetical protein TrRE_jg10094 [Triparma retinervis]
MEMRDIDASILEVGINMSPPRVRGGKRRMMRRATQLVDRKGSSSAQGTKECAPSSGSDTEGGEDKKQQTMDEPTIPPKLTHKQSLAGDEIEDVVGGELGEAGTSEPEFGSLFRTKSFIDRELAEAAQFAEAVGEEGLEFSFNMDEDFEDVDKGSSSVRDSVDTLKGIGLPPLPPSTAATTPQNPSPLIKVPAESNYVYKGLKFNPPQIVKRGLSRGNTSQLHRKAWLEVSDKYHRYGKNLRIYYRSWERLGHPFNMFFDWLDSKGSAAGQPLPNLEECSRAKLDADAVEYILDPGRQRRYGIRIEVRGDGERERREERNKAEKGIISCSPPVSSHFQAHRDQMKHSRLLPSGGEEGRFGDGSKGDNNAIFLDSTGSVVNTGPEGWIFVLRDGGMYAAPKVTQRKDERKKRFHHSSFFGGKAVEAAGIIITNDEGRLLRLYPHSGHYRPGEAHLQRTLLFLKKRGLKLRRFDVDLQQIFHVARKEALFIGEGIFSQIHKIRSSGARNVGDALTRIDRSDEPDE